MRRLQFLPALLLIAAAPNPDAELREEARKVYAPVVRATHVDPPLPGSFASMVAPVMAELEAAAYERESAEARLKKHKGAVLTLLRASRAKTGDPAPAASPLFADFWKDGNKGVAPIMNAFKLAATMIEQEAAAGQGAQALEHCVDALGVARDASYGGGLLGAGWSRALVNNVKDACGAALKAAPPEKRAVARGQLRRIREAWNTFERQQMEERVFMRLLLLEKADGLPAAARALLAKHPSRKAARPMTEMDRKMVEKAGTLDPKAREVQEKARATTLATILTLEAGAAASEWRVAKKAWPGKAELAAQVPGLEAAAVEVAEVGGELQLVQTRPGTTAFQVTVGGP